MKTGESRRHDSIASHPEPERPRRPWALLSAALLLAILVVVLWTKWSESRTEARELRAELRQVYVEAESLRTQAVQAQQRVSLLEQQVRAFSAEREQILRRLEALEGQRGNQTNRSRR